MTSSVRTASAPPAPDRQQPRTARAFRADIQGLRAIAVSLVLLLPPLAEPARPAASSASTSSSSSPASSSPRTCCPAAAHARATWPRSGRAASAGCCRPSLLVLAVTAVATRLVAPETRSGPPPPARSSPPRCTSRTGGWPATSVDYLAADERRLAGAALLVAVGRGAVLPRLAGAHPAARGPARRRRGWRTGAAVSARPRRRRRRLPGLLDHGDRRRAGQRLLRHPDPHLGAGRRRRCWRSPPPGPAHGCPPHRGGCGPCSPGPGWAPSSSRPLRYTGATPFPGWQAAAARRSGRPR